jgi:hypothetical protein
MKCAHFDSPAELPARSLTGPSPSGVIATQIIVIEYLFSQVTLPSEVRAAPGGDSEAILMRLPRAAT